jgi:2-haloacid dehalogenase
MTDATSHSPSIVVFDIGNVLIHWEPRRLCRRIFDEPAKVDWHLSHVCHSEWNLELDRGAVWREAIAERIALYPEYADEIRADDESWDEMVSGPVEGSVLLMDPLRAAGGDAPFHKMQGRWRQHPALHALSKR